MCDALVFAVLLVLVVLGLLLAEVGFVDLVLEPGRVLRLLAGPASRLLDTLLHCQLQRERERERGERLVHEDSATTIDRRESGDGGTVDMDEMRAMRWNE